MKSRHYFSSSSTAAISGFKPPRSPSNISGVGAVAIGFAPGNPTPDILQARQVRDVRCIRRPHLQRFTIALCLSCSMNPIRVNTLRAPSRRQNWRRAILYTARLFTRSNITIEPATDTLRHIGDSIWTTAWHFDAMESGSPESSAPSR